MLAGCANVASDVGEIRTALADGKAGRLVRPGDSADLAQVLGSLLAHPADAHALGASACRRGSVEYTGDRMAARYEGLYRTLLSTRDVEASPPGAEAGRAGSADQRASAGSVSVA